ncbi:MAG: hypothetical protein GY861_03350 [bacterium]|nr:hypothetical protein [bacterium]
MKIELEIIKKRLEQFDRYRDLGFYPPNTKEILNEMKKELLEIRKVGVIQLAE